MNDKLFQSLLDYLDFGRSYLRDITKRTRIGVSDEEQLSKIVDELEECREFSDLVRETRSNFAGDFHSVSSDDTWRWYVHNFFCQSGCYLELWRGHHVDINSLSTKYRDSFQEEISGVSYFVPIELVSFDTDFSIMDFDSFKIKKFSGKEVSTLIRNDINRIFYPYAALDKGQIGLLSRYWFLYSNVEESVEQIGYIHFPHSALTTLVMSGEAERWYTNFPEPIESALRSLSLYDWLGTDKNSLGSQTWSSRSDWEGLRLPNIPFVYKVRRSLLSQPQPVPDFSKLITQQFTDMNTGEYLGDIPEEWFSLTKEETDQFNIFMQKTSKILSNLNTKENDWDFIDIALGYFVKAFIASPDLDQMLWFITSFEALVGEPGKGVTRRLIDRLSLILNKDVRIPENKVRDRFEQIYDLRSSLVHGGYFGNQPYRNDIIDARLIARRTILWFLNTLDRIQTAICNKTIMSDKVRGRKRILAELDLYRQSKGILAFLP